MVDDPKSQNGLYGILDQRVGAHEVRNLIEHVGAQHRKEVDQEVLEQEHQQKETRKGHADLLSNGTGHW